MKPPLHKQMSKHLTKPTISRRAISDYSLPIHAVWLESLLIACAFYSLWAIQKG